jgi:hypothetical protein
MHGGHNCPLVSGKPVHNFVSLLQVTRCVYADRVTAGYLSVEPRLSLSLVSGKDGLTAGIGRYVA